MDGVSVAVAVHKVLFDLHIQPPVEVDASRYGLVKDVSGGGAGVSGLVHIVARVVRSHFEELRDPVSGGQKESAVTEIARRGRLQCGYDRLNDLASFAVLATEVPAVVRVF